MDLLKNAITQSLSDPAVADALRQMPHLVPALSQSLERAMRSHCGGQAVYIARRNSREQLQVRDDRLRSQFNGRNYGELASAEGLSERRVRLIVSRRSKK